MDVKQLMENGQKIWDRAQELLKAKLKNLDEDERAATDYVLEQYAQIIAASAFEQFLKTDVPKSSVEVLENSAKEMVDGLEKALKKIQQAHTN